MADVPTEKSATGTPAGGGLSAGTGVMRQGARPGGLQTEQGQTTIADPVVTKVAGIAAREVGGVYRLGGGVSRALGAVTQRLPGQDSSTQGVSVEVGQRQAAIDLDVIVDYGVPIVDLSQAIRDNVVSQVEQMTGLEVTEVNITVHDIFLDDGSEDTTEQESRVE